MYPNKWRRYRRHNRKAVKKNYIHGAPLQHVLVSEVPIFLSTGNSKRGSQLLCTTHPTQSYTFQLIVWSGWCIVESSTTWGSRSAKIWYVSILLNLSVTAHLSSESEENNTDSTVVRPTSTDPIGLM